MSVFWFFFALLGSLRAEFKVPALDSPVVDSAALLRPQERARLEQKLFEIQARGRWQGQILIVPSLEGEALESASIKVTDLWKLGDAKKDNGILILVALQERRMRIEVGQGLEGDVPDLRAKRIIDRALRPAFQRGNFAEGLMASLLELQSLVEPDLASAQDSSGEDFKASSRPFPFYLIALFWVLAVLLLSSGSGGGRRGLRQMILLTLLGGIGGRRGGGGSWSSRGGGGWSGGGGGFSGGGASGSW